MNSVKNKIQLIGRLGNDPEVKNFENDKVMARFSLATSESYRDSNGTWQEDTQWHKVVAWGNTAKQVEKLSHKGDEVLVEGKLVHRSYEDHDGNTNYITEVVINELIVVSLKSTLKNSGVSTN